MLVYQKYLNVSFMKPSYIYLNNRESVGQLESLMTVGQQHIIDGDSYSCVVGHWKAAIYQAIKSSF